MRTLFSILSLTIVYPSKLLLRTDRRSSASWRINHVYFQSWSNQQSPLQLVVMRSYVRTVESAQARTNSSVVDGSSQTARLSVLPKSVRRPIAPFSQQGIWNPQIRYSSLSNTLLPLSGTTINIIAVKCNEMKMMIDVDLPCSRGYKNKESCKVGHRTVFCSFVSMNPRSLNFMEWITCQKQNIKNSIFTVEMKITPVERRPQSGQGLRHAQDSFSC